MQVPEVKRGGTPKLPRDVKLRREAIANRRMTSHWSVDVELFPSLPRTYGNEKNVEKNELFHSTKVPRPVLTPHGERLCGF